VHALRPLHPRSDRHQRAGRLRPRQPGADRRLPRRPLDNELSGNVIDLCPVGALLDKDFLLPARLEPQAHARASTASPQSGDNISIEHNEGKVYRVKPRTNMDVNKWWITDEVRYGWKFVHDPRLLPPSPMHKVHGVHEECDWNRPTPRSAKSSGWSKLKKGPGALGDGQPHALLRRGGAAGPARAGGR
jgi:NADH-quinone oxidoreductase subunit G